MKIISGDALLEGGTTSLKVESKTRMFSITIDYSLPNDNRQRFVYIGEGLFENDNQLKPNSDEEKSLLQALKSECIKIFGESEVKSFLNGETANMGQKEWFFALNFLKLVQKERDYI